MTYYYRLARLPQDAEQIHRLNYRTFVEEIPQHDPNDQRQLVDPYHEENTYLLCMKDGELAGMIALRDARPFSLDRKIGPIEQSLNNPPERPVEIRLLAMEPEHRTGRPFFGILQALVNWCLKKGYDAAVISGTVRELKLYRRLGFKPFAEPVGTEQAKYVPMILSRESYEGSAAGRLATPMVNLLPGPAAISENVRRALAEEPISHRSPAFTRLLGSVKRQLTDLTGAAYVHVLQGTGTLANDAVAAQLSRIDGKGLILVNGEFGRRLLDHAERMGLEFVAFETQDGQVFPMKEIGRQLDQGAFDWLWFVHCETSTGVLNDMDTISQICRDEGVKVAVDCASSLGTVPLDLRIVDFASSVSGKGLAGYSGLALVFHNGRLEEDRRLPRYLDIGLYEEGGGIPFTQSSNLLAALDQALRNLSVDPDRRYGQLRRTADRLRKGAGTLGISVLASEESASPGILTFVLPPGRSAQRLGDDLFLNGFRTHYESGYLLEHNWLQAAVMNGPDDRETDRFLAVLAKLSDCETLSSAAPYEY
ncbi:aminotransferase class V-fold PLP-dependent enzyme [Sporosarcina trichiuri]|uniref:aminotransferase class V-fold PLP-dependent enzyme n=1 Tax=Sporosarcina trichiuri TaxID=3056445 RepID=UPI0025B5F617|nr:aminotransferase class V-fold PLP-dependent enzyme [Sporosarcina sp. 0.2-SM1T-5]WJY26319.1 aminotransferase class V-fold PLP-dependent enzyme [Sporosarcina sp. 0.2-SM1T-5]